MSGSAEYTPKVYTPRIFSMSNAKVAGAARKVPETKTDTVYHVDKRDTWRKIEVCPCFKEESFYPQVVSLFDCLNKNYGERSGCISEQLAVDHAILADMKAKQAAKNA